MEEDQDHEFEITDFTSVSAWERFTTSVEDLFREWLGVKVQETPTEPLDEQKKTLYFEGMGQFDFTFYKDTEHPEVSPLECMMNREFDFPSRAHHLQRWFGVSSFILITREQSNEEPISPSQASTLLSTVSMVLFSNTGLQSVPVFIVVKENWRGTYMGIMNSSGSHIRFDADYQAKTPSKCKTFLGLVKLFQSKLALYNQVGNITAATHFTYVKERDEWKPQEWNSQWLQTATDKEKLLWLPVEDPIEALHLGISFYYPRIEEYDLSDDAIPSDNIPVDAPRWNVRCTFSERPYCLLAESIKELMGFFVQSQHIRSMNQVKNSIIGSVTSQPIVGSIGLNTFHDAEPTAEELDSMLGELFQPVEEQTQFRNDLPDLKGAPANTLLSLFSLKLLSLRSLRVMALVWQEFQREVRWHWEHLVFLPRTPTPTVVTPNTSSDNKVSIELSACILYQKLQMLNYCIAHRKNRNEIRNKATQGHSDGWEVELEEPSTSTSQVAEKQEIEGCLLLNGQQMYAPLTQDAGVMTEDMVVEQEQVFANLGTSEEARKIRIRMQAASLLSDMQAFKAANPGAVIEDFVRWHSPKDLTESGELSARMKDPDNMWQQLWQESEAVEVSKQRALFDSTTQAEKILHYFETMAPCNLIRQMMAVALGAIYNNLSNCHCSSVQTVSDALTKLRKSIRDSTSWFRSIDDAIEPSGVIPDEDGQHLKQVIESLMEVETTVYRITSLLQKFDDYEIAMHLFLNGDKDIQEEQRRKHVAKLFTNSLGQLQPPDAREFILRAVTVDDNRSEEDTPGNETEIPNNRMYVLQTRNEFRLSIACTKFD